MPMSRACITTRCVCKIVGVTSGASTVVWPPTTIDDHESGGSVVERDDNDGILTLPQNRLQILVGSPTSATSHPAPARRARPRHARWRGSRKRRVFQERGGLTLTLTEGLPVLSVGSVF
jgi:hypothetical protein